MKVLMILSKIFKTDSRVRIEANTLIENGHEVRIIVWDRKNKYSEYEKVGNTQVYRIKNKGLMRILPNDLFRNPIWWRKAYKKALEIKKEYDFDVVHCHDLDTLQAGVWIKNKTNCKLIYDAHEIFGYIIQNKVPNFIVKRTFKMEKKLIKNIDKMITISTPFEKYFKTITKKPITIVMNCKDLVYEKYEPKKNKIFTLLYIGSMGSIRFFPQIVGVVGNIPNVRFKIAGLRGWLYDEVERRSKKYENIDFLGTIPNDEIMKQTRAADAVYMVVNSNFNQPKMTLFNKQFEAMVCGTPIICSRGTNSGDMTEKLNCGIVVDYNEESIKQGIIKLRDDKELCEKLGKNAFNAAKERYNWEIEKKNLLNVYEEIK